MISQIAGKVVERKSQGVLIDVQGLCYEIFIPAAILQALDGQASIDSSLRLYTFHYHHVEPSRATPVLIGFTNEVEREFFEQFITVSGVGPKAALRAISKPIPHIARAIDQGDVEFLKSLPGIGTQRAKEIVAKLQGKVGKFGLLPDSDMTASHGKVDVAQEALAILTQLQYKPAEAKSMIQRALERVPNVETAEELLNEVYRQRSAPKGFTLMELLVTVSILGLLMVITFPGYQRYIEKSRGTEAVGTFAFVRGGYQNYIERNGSALNVNCTESSTSDANWRRLGVENPNIPANVNFRYRYLVPATAGLSSLTGYRCQAVKRRSKVSRQGSVDNTRYLEIQLDTGEIQKSGDY